MRRAATPATTCRTPGVLANAVARAARRREGGLAAQGCDVSPLLQTSVGDNRAVDSALRADRGAHPPARADRAGRRGLLPRLRRRRLDLPLARARRARLPRLRAAREPPAARRGLRRRTRAFCRDVLGAEVVELDGRGLGEAELREQRYSVAPRPPARDRATPPPTRSRRSSTGSSRAAARPGWRRGATTASCIRCCRSGATETVAYCEAERLAFRVDASNADTKRGLIRDADPAAAPRAASGRRREHPARARRRGRRCRRRSPSCSTSAGGLEARRPRRRRCRRCASTTGSGSSTARSISTARSAGASGASAPASQGLRYEAGGPATGSPGGRRRFKTCSSTPKIPRSEREAWPLVVRGDDVDRRAGHRRASRGARARRA